MTGLAGVTQRVTARDRRRPPSRESQLPLVSMLKNQERSFLLFYSNVRVWFFCFFFFNYYRIIPQRDCTVGSAWTSATA